MMLLQRACVAESQVKNKSANGPLRAQSNVPFRTEYSATYRHTLVVGDVSASHRAHGLYTVNQGGTTDNVYSSLTDNASVKDFLFAAEKNKDKNLF